MSTSSRDNRVIASMTKPRRSPPGDVQGSVFFTGQGGRTVLPPLSSAFPTSRFPVPHTYTTPYTQPRSSPGRYELSSQAFNNCGPWSPSNTSPQLSATYPNYETTERYSSLSNYTTTAYPSRTSSPVGASPDSPGEPRRLPPIPGTPGVDRWSPSAYIGTTSSSYPTARSSTAVYPSVYNSYTPSNPTAYSYSIPQDHNSQPQPQLATLTPNPHTTHAAIYGEPETQRLDARPASPYGGGTSPVSQSNMPTAPTGSSTSPEEPTIKKKRKRADATQLKALNETYARTAFPSTEERNHLAKMLDMSPRSVQIWFQNKRQSMRQTSRQSSSASSTAHHSFPVAPPADIMDDMGHSSSAYSSGTVTMTDMSFLTAAPQDASRAHSRITASHHHRIRSPEESESRKWPRSY